VRNEGKNQRAFGGLEAVGNPALALRVDVTVPGAAGAGLATGQQTLGAVSILVNNAEVFSVRAGECMFLPRGIPHAFLIASEEIHIITLITHGGFLDAINKMNAPAERMELPR